MSKSERPGYATLTLEVPIEVAEWLAANGELLAQMASIAAAKAQRQSVAHQCQREASRQARKIELWSMGRNGYRLFRRFGGGKHVANQIDLIDKVALQLGVDPKVLKFAVLRFKRAIENKVRNRRGREITRLYLAGLGNAEIAKRLKVHKNTLSNYLRDHKAEIRAYARAHPGSCNTLKKEEITKVSEPCPGSLDPISWKAIKQAGGRA